MDAKYLAEIRARCEADLPDVAAPVFRDRKALIAEVERLNQQIATLTRALDMACAELNLSDVEKVFAPDYFIRQAQEQEADDEKV